jgi:hypothetical protein
MRRIVELILISDLNQLCGYNDEMRKEPNNGKATVRKK